MPEPIRGLHGSNGGRESISAKATIRKRFWKSLRRAIEALGNFKQRETDIKVWCKGHLPIRKIIVGPGEKQKEIKESLEFYRHTVYWLRYIDIEESKIPLRS